MRVLVCGGRHFEDYGKVVETLDKFRSGITLIIHGACIGADLLAERYAKECEINYIGIPAKWSRDGNSAGPIRNNFMLNYYPPDIVIAFKGGKGTADMVRKAKDLGIKVVEVE